MRRIYVVGLIAVIGCANARRVNGPDGSGEWYAVDCTHNQSNCVEKAGEVCPNGYVIASSDGREGVYMQATKTGAIATSTYNGEMLIKCRDSKSTETTAKASTPPECQVDGIYKVMGSRLDGDCPESSKPATDRFTTLPDGTVQMEIAELPGFAPIGTVKDCTWTAMASMAVTDVAQARARYSYQFTKTGIVGTLSLVYPPTSDSPNGCHGTSKVVGTRL